MQGGFFSGNEFLLLEIALVICFSSFYFMEDRNRQLWAILGFFQGHLLVPPCLWRGWREEEYLVLMFFELSLVQSLMV